MSESLLFGIASILILGVSAQWLAWRFNIPSILLLLGFGFLAGPLMGLLDPDQILGPVLFPIVSLSVGIILFEGGLSLRMDDFREVGKIVINLITLGVLVTWVLATLAAHYIIGFGWEVATVIGAILTVTGPTVVIPLLRDIRPRGRVSTIARWEGITIDPIGAVLAVLVLEGVILLSEPSGSVGTTIGYELEGLLRVIVIGVGTAVAGGAMLILMLRYRLIPEYLQNAMALMIVVLVFAVADMLQHETGLLATTLMGIGMANQNIIDVHRLTKFKEDIGVLLIGILFILLSARLDLADIRYINFRTVLFLVSLMLVVRPIAVWISARGTNVTRKEKLFLSWLAPRGIVAAAVASLFGFRLEELFPQEAAALAPVIFFVIVGTVMIYGLSLGPLARRMGIAQAKPQGLLLVGATDWVIEMGQVLKANKVDVLLLDTNRNHIKKARAAGLPAEQGNVLEEGIADDINLGGIGRLLALTPNDEVNALAALQFAEVFGREEVFQLGQSGPKGKELSQHLRGRLLFGLSFSELEEIFLHGAVVETLVVDEGFSYAKFIEAEGKSLPLFLIHENKGVEIFTGDGVDPAMMPGDKLVYITGVEIPESADVVA